MSAVRKASLVLLFAARLVAAQDFAPAAPAGPRPGALALLERALPAPGGAFALESQATRWFALPELETRAAALQVPAGAARVALGLSQTGDPELGWTAAALALGATGAPGGAALRAVARHDRREGALRDGALARGGGLEAGAGAWCAAGDACVFWASAPQVWTGGAAPPLVRPLELGVRTGGDGLAAWATLLSPLRGDDGERAAGVSLVRGGLVLWAEARDAPLRGSFGLAARVGALAIEARADAHPLLGETTRLACAWRPHARTEVR